MDALHPSLTRRIDLACEPFDADQIAERASFAFLALPHTASLAVVPALRKRNVRVIDLSADYRLSDPQVYADWYGHEHTDLIGLKQAVYGLPELFRDQIPPAQLIANPGCYTSTSILALAPLIAEDLIERTGIIIDAKSGVSGAGRSPKLNFHFPECNESFSAYNVGWHRHTPEIDQVLTTMTSGRGEAVEVIFTPHLVPMDRGIFATIYARPKQAAVEHDLLELFRSFYAQPVHPDRFPLAGDQGLRAHQLLRHHAPGRPRSDRDPRLPRQPDQGGRGCGRPEPEPHAGLPRRNSAALKGPCQGPERQVKAGVEP